MTRSEIELIDGGYGLVKKDRISSNQIKTRPTSFSAISNVWNNFRLKYYKDKLAAEKASALTQSFDVDAESKLTDAAIEQINNKSVIIAKLEEKIKILSKQSVPTNYVDNRAIKLRSKMMSNLVYNCSNAYSIGVDKMNDVFGSDVVDESVSDSLDSNDIMAVADIQDVSVGVSEDDSNTDAKPSIEPVIDINDTSVAEDSIEQPIMDKVVDSEPDVVVQNDDSLVKEPETVSLDIDDSQQNVDTVTDIDSGAVDFSTENGDLSISRADIKDAVDSAFARDSRVDDSVDSVSFNDYVSENVISDDSDAQFDGPSYDVGDDYLAFDNDEPALFELINPNENEQPIVSDVKTDYVSTIADESIVSDSQIGDLVVSKNGSSIAKIDKYKDSTNDYEYRPVIDEESVSVTTNAENQNTHTSNYVSRIKPFKIITFKDIFRPAAATLTDVENVQYFSSQANDIVNNERDIPIIVPERNSTIEMENVVSSSIDESSINISDIQDMKNKYIKLLQLLKSKTARMNSVGAQRDTIRSEVESSNKSKNDATASFNEKYQQMTKYISNLQKRCDMVDDETAIIEDDINKDMHIIEVNRKFVSSTQKAIEELDDILRSTDFDSSESEIQGYSRRAA